MSTAVFLSASHNPNWVTKTPKAKILKATVGLADRVATSKLRDYLQAKQFRIRAGKDIHRKNLQMFFCLSHELHLNCKLRTLPIGIYNLFIYFVIKALLQSTQISFCRDNCRI